MPLSKRQRRMTVLPAPDGVIDASDRAQIGIFYSFMFIVTAITKPLRRLFDAERKALIFQSAERVFTFVSKRKKGS